MANSKNIDLVFSAAAKTMLLWTAGMVLVAVVGWILNRVFGCGTGCLSWLVLVWIIGVGFLGFFYRNPRKVIQSDPHDVLCPAYGTVDAIDEVEEPEVVGGKCKRVSIFLSVFDVHVQKAPIAGKVLLVKHTPGKFLNALRRESANVNENVLIGIESADFPGCRIGIRLIAGAIARRVTPFIEVGDTLSKGQTISLIQFGSRVDIYLPPRVELCVKLGERVAGSQTILARI